MKSKQKSETYQQIHWNEVFTKSEAFFGEGPSAFGQVSLELFRQKDVCSLLEVGCGQGRDAFLFAQNEIEVTALDYSEIAVSEIRERAIKAALTAGCDPWTDFGLAVAGQAGASTEELKEVAAIVVTVNAFKTRALFNGKIGTDEVESSTTDRKAPEPAPGKTWGGVNRCFSWSTNHTWVAQTVELKWDVNIEYVYGDWFDFSSIRSN